MELQTRSLVPNEVKSIKFPELSDLDKWYNSKDKGSQDKFRIPREKLSNYTRSRNTAGKTDLKVLVCHDFKGNYQPEEDESPLGYFPHSSGDHYFLQFPSLVDYFIYFSHNRITVPPVSWINSLHRHAIPVLGTIIVEGANNSSLDELVEQDDEDGQFKYVKALSELTRHYQFDGWLINVESTFRYSQNVPKLLLFVESLKAELHRNNPQSKVVWYDSFVSGRNRVFYQNGVNEQNFEYFDGSDFFFTNYWWDEQSLKRNILNVGLQGVKKKLYVGIDIWGRGSKVGNGGFETGVAINFLRVYSSNVALFAPAWTYENFAKRDFVLNDQKFWTGDSNETPGGSVSTYIAHTSAPVYKRDDDIIFYTNFSQGEGLGFNVFGKTVFDQPWVNGSLQGPVPSSIREGLLEVDKTESFNGGTSLKVIFSTEAASTRSNKIELFKFQNDIKSRNINVAISFKSNSNLPDESLFQLEVEYYIERRYRSVTKVRSGVFKVNLQARKNWKYIETSFALPRLQAREHFVLSAARVNWIPDEETSILHDDNERSWIMLTNENPNQDIELLVGDLLIEGTERSSELRSIRRVHKKDFDGKVFVGWEDGQDDDVLLWHVHINTRFVGVSTVPFWILNRRDRLRVDIISRTGKLTRGDDIFI